MKLGMNIKYFSRDVGMETAAKILQESELLFLDYTPSFNETDREVENTISIFEKYNLSTYQTHAPFNRYGTFKSAEEHKAAVARCLENTVRLGAKFMVVHGDEFDFDNMEYSKKAVLQYNYEFFFPFIEEAEKNGITVAFENVFEDSPNRPRFCSETDDLAELIHKFNTKNVCACWDYGHGAVANHEAHGDSIRLLGKTIQCTHVHDNYFGHDSHMIPFFGKIDWADCMDATKTTWTDAKSIYHLALYRTHLPTPDQDPYRPCVMIQNQNCHNPKQESYAVLLILQVMANLFI